MAGAMNQTGAAICEQAQSLLVVIDVQTRLMAAMNRESRDAVVGGAGQLLRAAGLLDIPVIISEQYPRGLGHTEPVVAEHKPAVCEVVEKTAFSVRGVEQFDKLLEMTGRRQIVLCGAEAHVCVLQSALMLCRDGYDVFVAADAVCSRATGNRDNALFRMQSAGAAITNVESVLFEWLGDSRHPAFKDVSAIIQ